MNYELLPLNIELCVKLFETLQYQRLFFGEFNFLKCLCKRFDIVRRGLNQSAAMLLMNQAQPIIPCYHLH